MSGGAGESRVALYAAIRREARAGMSNRALQHKHGVGYRTAPAALNSVSKASSARRTSWNPEDAQTAFI
ncbi:hypothetical protein [Janibacter sp. GXQ6167]|uniref:hypothetical protein n=1 Tax=Janibacter sp. GXQ6167 TaxID=3240791 RepID=UPI00352627F4